MMVAVNNILVLARNGRSFDLERCLSQSALYDHPWVFSDAFVSHLLAFHNKIMRINQFVYQCSHNVRGFYDDALHKGFSDLLIGVAEHVWDLKIACYNNILCRDCGKLFRLPGLWPRFLYGKCLIFFHHNSLSDFQVSYFFLGAEHTEEIKTAKKSNLVIVVLIIFLFIHDVSFIDAIDVLTELAHESIELFFFFVDFLL